MKTVIIIIALCSGLSLFSASNQPVFETIYEKTAYVNNLLKFEVICSNVSDDRISYSSTIPEGASYNIVTHIFRWIPKPADLGKKYTITFLANNETSSTTQELIIDVYKDDVILKIGKRADEKSFKRDIVFEKGRDAIIKWSTTILDGNKQLVLYNNGTRVLKNDGMPFTLNQNPLSYEGESEKKLPWLSDKYLPDKWEIKLEINGNPISDPLICNTTGFFSMLPAFIDDDDYQGLMWYHQYDGKYFDKDKPTIIFVHGWCDIRDPQYYDDFKYKDDFLQKGYNVGFYRWQTDTVFAGYSNSGTQNQEVTNICDSVWVSGFKGQEENDGQVIKIPQISIYEHIVRLFYENKQQMEYLSDNKYLFYDNRSSSNAGVLFAARLSNFFFNIAGKDYDKEITLLGHSIGCQLIISAFEVFRKDIYKDMMNYKYRIVFAEAYIPRNGKGANATNCQQYNLMYMADNVKYISEKNPVIHIYTGFIGKAALSNMKYNTNKYNYSNKDYIDNVSVVKINTYKYKMVSWDKKYLPYYANRAEYSYQPYNSGRKHLYAIDWYCLTLNQDPPPVKGIGNITPSVNTSREILMGNKGKTFIQKKGKQTWETYDDTFIIK